MSLGRDWAAASGDVADLDPAGRLASPVDTWLQQQARVGLFELGAFPTAPNLGAGIADALGSATEDAQTIADRWAAMVLQDENTEAASATGEIANGAARFVLTAKPIEAEAVTLTLTIGPDGRPLAVVS